MYFEVSNKIKAVKATREMHDWCKDNLVVRNPEYDKKVRMGFWAGGTPEYLCLYETDGDNIIMPFGCSSQIINDYPKATYVSEIKPPQRFICHSNINLYEYQEKAVNEALKRRNGVLVMPCGSGKTQTALEIIARLGVKTLWLTHTQDLLNQSMQRAKSVLDCDSKTYGTITGGKVNIGTGITFATVQTMAKLDLSQYKDTWSCIVVDECHKAIGTPTKVMQFYKVLSNLSCRYKFGLTATPKRADGLQVAMFALIGKIICEVSKAEVADTTCPVKVEFIETGFEPDFDAILSGDGTLNYVSLVDVITHDKERMYDVARKVKEVSSDGATLVLANRVEYLKKIAGILENAGCKCLCLSALGTSKKSKEIRKEALRKLNAGELDCVLATYQLAKEGLDVPNLRYVVFATPEKDETTVMQAAGRVGRKYDGKECGVVIDFVDNFGMLKGWQKKRRGFYRKLGYEEA